MITIQMLFLLALSTSMTMYDYILPNDVSVSAREQCPDIVGEVEEIIYGSGFCHTFQTVMDW